MSAQDTHDWNAGLLLVGLAGALAAEREGRQLTESQVDILIAYRLHQLAMLAGMTA